MRFTEHYYLVEMLVVGDKPQADSTVLAFDKWIWVMNDDSPNLEKTQKDIISKIPEDVDTTYFGSHDFSEKIGDDPYEFASEFQENVLEDALVGQIQDDGSLYIIDRGSFKHDPKSSVLVKKVVKQLGLNSARYSEDMESTETEVGSYEMKGQMAKEVFHGTTSNYLPNIMKKGLRPSESESNYITQYQHIEHPDKIFFSTRIGEAMHHSQNTSGKKGGTPIILKMSVPDPAKVTADYDVETLTGQRLVYRNYDVGGRKASQTKPMSLSRDFGVYGYEGAIMPKFIESVYVSTKGEGEEVYSLEDFVEVEPKEALKELFPDEYWDEEDWDDEE